MVLEASVLCGAEYQEGDATSMGTTIAGAPTCRCGTFAIGLCAGCGLGVCGDHSELVDDTRKCSDCSTAEAKERTVAAARSSADARRSHDDILEDWRVNIRTALANDPPEAAACRVLRQAAERTSVVQFRMGGGTQRREWARNLPLRATCAAFGVELPSDEAIALWFATACLRPPTTLRGPDRRTILGGWKRTSLSGWAFPQGSTRQLVSRDTVDSSRWLHADAGVSADGARIYSTLSSFQIDCPDPKQWAIGSDTFNSSALAEMAELAGLPLLPRRPDGPKPTAGLIIP